MYFMRLFSKGKKPIEKSADDLNNVISINNAVKMNINGPHVVKIGPDGFFTGNIFAITVTIMGKFCGNILGAERVTLKRGASVNGQITARHAIIEDNTDGHIDFNISRKHSLTDITDNFESPTSVENAKGLVSQRKSKSKMVVETDSGNISPSETNKNSFFESQEKPNNKYKKENKSSFKHNGGNGYW